MYWQAEKISTSWYSIPKFTPTPADSLPRLPQPAQSLSSLPAVKRPRRKTWQALPMSYGYVNVAQISMGADFNQTVKALTEAEAYPGPSLIIAYAPCINHGIKKGMSKAQTEEQLAVECGYWHNFRYNPALAAEGKAAFTLDSKEPSGDYQAFLDGEVRYNSLKRSNPAKAEKLFALNESQAKARYTYLKKLIALYGPERIKISGIPAQQPRQSGLCSNGKRAIANLAQVRGAMAPFIREGRLAGG